MKKRIFAFCLVLFFMSMLCGLAMAQDSGGPGDSGIPMMEGIADANGDGIPDEIGDENIKNITDKGLDKLKYLEKEWKKILLDVGWISSLDSFFRKVNILFLIFLGTGYDLTLPFFFLSLLWLLVLIKSGESLRKGAGLGFWPAYLGGLGVAILLAQTQILRIFVTWFIKFLYFPGSVIKEMISWIIFIGFLAVVFVIWKSLNNSLEKSREKTHKEDVKSAEEETLARARALREASE